MDVTSSEGQLPNPTPAPAGAAKRPQSSEDLSSSNNNNGNNGDNNNDGNGEENKKKRRKSHAGVPWEVRYEELADFHRQFHHCKVPMKYAPNPALGIWVNNQKAFYRNGMAGKKPALAPDRIEKMNKLGICWDARRQKLQQQPKPRGGGGDDKKKATKTSASTHSSSSSSSSSTSSSSPSSPTPEAAIASRAKEGGATPVPVIDEDALHGPTVPEGVTLHSSGKWHVEISLYDQNCGVGEYDDVGDAVMISLVANDYLKLHRNNIFSSRDIERILTESARSAQLMFTYKAPTTATATAKPLKDEEETNNSEG